MKIFWWVELQDICHYHANSSGICGGTGNFQCPEPLGLVINSSKCFKKMPKKNGVGQDLMLGLLGGQGGYK